MPRSRAAETRDTETRQAELRPAISVEEESDLYVDPKKIPHDRVYRWVREMVLNMPDTSHMTVMMRKGWSPVPASRHPEMVPPPFPGQEDKVPTVIRFGGLILMEMDKRRAEAIREQQREKNLAQLRGIRISDMGASGPGEEGPSTQIYANQVGFERTREFKK